MLSETVRVYFCHIDLEAMVLRPQKLRDPPWVRQVGCLLPRSKESCGWFEILEEMARCLFLSRVAVRIISFPFLV